MNFKTGYKATLAEENKLHGQRTSLLNLALYEELQPIYSSQIKESIVERIGDPITYYDSYKKENDLPTK